MCGEEGPDQMSSKSDVLGTEPLSVIQLILLKTIILLL